jgi:hypothetical protein
MAESQARSVAQLESPICSACQIAMIWYRSIRADSNSAVRLFYCPKCNEIGHSRQKIESASSNTRSFEFASSLTVGNQSQARLISNGDPLATALDEPRDLPRAHDPADRVQGRRRHFSDILAAQRETDRGADR